MDAMKEKMRSRQRGRGRSRKVNPPTVCGGDTRFLICVEVVVQERIFYFVPPFLHVKLFVSHKTLHTAAYVLHLHLQLCSTIQLQPEVHTVGWDRPGDVLHVSIQGWREKSTFAGVESLESYFKKRARDWERATNSSSAWGEIYIFFENMEVCSTVQENSVLSGHICFVFQSCGKRSSNPR